MKQGGKIAGIVHYVKGVETCVKRSFECYDEVKWFLGMVCSVVILGRSVYGIRLQVSGDNALFVSCLL